MGAVVASLSKGETLCALNIALAGIFVFGLLFLVGWIAEETIPKEHRWNKYRTLFIVMAISGVAGEWIADIADFGLSEHLETIVERETNEHTNRINLQAGDRFLDGQLASGFLKDKPKGTAEIWYKPNDREAYDLRATNQELAYRCGMDSTANETHPIRRRGPIFLTGRSP